MTSVPPSPYTRAVTSAASSMMKAMSSSMPPALATARSRIRLALPVNTPASSSGRPYSIASSAPDTSDRSAIMVASSPCSCISCRSSRCDRFPAALPGSTNSGITTSAMRLSCHDSQNIAASTRTRFSSTDSDSDNTTPTTRWVSSTSSIRETSDPVWVRVKNASGCRRTCRNTLARSSRTRLSPIHSEYHDLTYPAPAPTRPSPATASASVTTTPARCRRMPSSMISRKISGLTTTITESTTVMSTSSTIGPRYRRRYGQTRRTVPGRTCCRVTPSQRYRNQYSGAEIMQSTIPGPHVLVVCPRADAPGLVWRRDQAGFVGGDDELYPVPGAQLGQQPGHVRLDGACGDIQGGGDLGVGHAQAHQPEHLTLAVGDPGQLPGLAVGTVLAGELPDQAAGDPRRDHGVADRDHADGGQDVLQGHVLDQEPAGPGPQRAVDVVIVVERGEHEHPGVRARRGDQLGGLNAVHARHADVHDDHIGAGVLGEPYRLDSRSGLAGHVDIGGPLDQPAQSGPDERLVVGEDDLDGHRAGTGTGSRAATWKPPPGRGPAEKSPPISAARSRMPVIP